MKRQDWMSAEEWMALLVCHLYRNEWIESEIRNVVMNETVDCRKLESLCRKQRIYPQLQDAVCTSALRELYDTEKIIAIERDLRIYDLRYLKYEKEILRIQNALDDWDVKMVVFKGISYYGTLYPSRKQRSLGDIDIIVNKEDIVKAVRCLEDLGYAASEKTKGWEDEHYMTEAQRCIHTAQFTGACGIEIELHTPAYFYSGYSLQTAYDHAILQRAGIRIPGTQDVFWIACVHSWHHFAMRKNPMNTGFHMLGYLLDVYVGYEYMKKLYTESEILKMAGDYGIEDIVRLIVYAAYHVLEPEANPMHLTEVEYKLIDWNYGDMSLTLERRLLRGSECADMMDKQRLLRMHPIEIKSHGDSFNFPYCLQASYYDEEAKWPVNILEAGSIEHPLQYFNFNLTWSTDYLVVCIQQVGYMQWRENSDIYDDYLTHLMLRVGRAYKKEPQNIIFQICDGKMYAYMSQDNQPWDIYGYVVPEIRCIKNTEDIYTCYIPWSVLGMDEIKPGMQFYLDLQTRITTERERKYIDICWLAGNCGCQWQEIKDCSFLTPACLGL